MKKFSLHSAAIAIALLFVMLLPSLGTAAVDASKKPTLIELMTSTCPACGEMAKVLEDFSKKHGEQIMIQVVNVQEYPDVGALYRVRYVPTLVFLDEFGKVLDKRVGYMPLDALEKYWAELGYTLKGK